MYPFMNKCERRIDRSSLRASRLIECTYVYRTNYDGWQRDTPSSTLKRLNLGGDIWVLSWQTGRLWTFRVSRVRNFTGGGTVCPETQMKMLGLYLEQQMNNALTMTCNLWTQRQKKYAFTFFQLILSIKLT